MASILSIFLHQQVDFLNFFLFLHQQVDFLNFFLFLHQQVDFSIKLFGFSTGQVLLLEKCDFDR